MNSGTLESPEAHGLLLLHSENVFIRNSLYWMSSFETSARATHPWLGIVYDLLGNYALCGYVCELGSRVEAVTCKALVLGMPLFVKRNT
jgi:hypothetical protein